ncbi:MAG: NAD(P)-dependent oxidoreductase [Candidatus Latescibacteria bacterium]|nr:NAD(P)-dependent oxidoreductase [Candidatus Latescibacterota bacterium]
MDTVLVTGATGFVGREVVRHLIELGKTVTALGRTQPEEPIPFIQADLTDAAGLQRALNGRSFDGIIHLASLPGDTGNPIQMVQVNVNGCQNLLEYARQAAVSRFVLASSISAYEWYPATKFNPPDSMPVDEDHPCRPKDIYSTTKRVQELLALTYYHQYQLPATVLRLTAVVGPHGRGGGRGWREFAGQLAEGKRVQVPHFSAEELCHYVDFRDVARMHVAAAEHPGAVGQVFNCCGPVPTRGMEFVEIVKRFVPDIEVDYGFPWSMAQGGEIAFDMSKAKRLIDFEPRYNLSDSIKSIKDWIDAGGLTEAESASDRTYGAGAKKGLS